MATQMNEILDSAPASGLGYTSVLATISFQLLEWLEGISIDDTIQMMVSIGGLLFLIYKIRGQHLENKNKALDKKLKERELRALEREDAKKL